MRILTIAAACLALTLTAPIVMAGHSKEDKDGHKGKKMFKKADTNSDGFISLDEMKAAEQKKLEHMKEKMANSGDYFAKADADNDGKLSKEEVKTLHELRRADRKERKERD